jgi:ubiquitin C-terminal hydrolase
MEDPADNDLRCGLRNKGNNCFINATLQCLAVSPFLIDYIKFYMEEDANILECLKKFELSKYKSDQVHDICKNILESSTYTLSETDEKYLKQFMRNSNSMFIYISFKQLIKNLYIRRERTLDPDVFISIAKDASANTGFDHLFSGEQNDPHEFLAYLLDVVHNAKSTEVIINMPDNIDGYSAVNKQYLHHFKSRYEKDHSYFVKNFYYYLVNCVQCVNCTHRSYEVCPNDMICLPLPEIRRDSDITIMDCFRKMFAIESLDYKCEKCGNAEGNKIEKKFLTKPKTLILKIKRYANIGNTLMKINKFIEYPETIDIKEFSCFETHYKYELYAVINHVGSLNGGHYYSYVRNLLQNDDGESVYTNTWFLCNDVNVSKMDRENVLKSNNAYILFYHIRTADNESMFPNNESESGTDDMVDQSIDTSDSIPCPMDCSSNMGEIEIDFI